MMKSIFTKEDTMWKCWILILCATAISCGLVESQNFTNNRVRNRQHKIQRFACPVGFFRLKRKCYYFSAGVATWRDSYFHCKDRNSTLAMPDTSKNDRILRKFLMGDQFTKFERWIGGIYNHEQKVWSWGISAKKIVFQNFETPKLNKTEEYAWHCIVVDPSVEYKWKPVNCVKEKHYICEASPSKIERRRRKRIDSDLVPQNQRQKSKGKKNGKGKGKRKEGKKGEGVPSRHNRNQQGRRGGWNQQNKDRMWVHGEKPGSRPPNNTRLINGTRIPNRMRHRPSIYPERSTPKITQITPQGEQYDAFLADGSRNHPQAITEDDFKYLTHEEILLKT